MTIEHRGNNGFDWKALLIGFTFSTIYVGTMVLSPVIWAYGNIVMLTVALYIKSKIK